MRVLAVSTWFPTPAAPTSGVFVAKDIAALAADHDVTFVHLAPPAAFRSAPARDHSDGIPVQRILLDPRRPWTLLTAARRLHRMAAEADLVHTMAFSSMLPFLFGRPSVPWVHTEHWSGLSGPHSLPAVLRFAVRLGLPRLLARPDVVVPVCEFLARPVRRVRRGEIVVVPCIVERPDMVPPRRQLRASDRLDLVAVGGLVDRKDPLVAVQALARLRENGVEARLTWVGEGPLRSAVTELAERLGVAQAVDLPGSKTPAEVSAALADADIFLLPTTAENFCVSGAEALAHGRPVVLGSYGGQGEYVTDRVGRLVDDQSAQAYADAVLAVRDSLADVPADEVAADVRRRFSVEAVRQGYRAVYERAVAVHG